MEPVDVWTYVSAALADEKLHDLAYSYLQAAIPGLMQAEKQRRGTVRGSDAGRCVLEVHADLNDLCEPFSPEVMLTRLNIGAIYGAYIASLFKAGYEAADEAANHTVIVEAEGKAFGAPCHADIMIFETATFKNLFTVEVKTNYKASNPDEPRLAYPHQMLQAAHQAMAFGVDQFAIFTLAPAAQWKKGIKPIFHRQDNYRTMEFAAAVTQEYGTRLAPAIEQTPPECNGVGFWKAYCRNVHCPHKKVEAVG